MSNSSVSFDILSGGKGKATALYMGFERKEQKYGTPEHVRKGYAYKLWFLLVRETVSTHFRRIGKMYATFFEEKD